MSFKAKVSVDPTRRHGAIDPRVYGQFIEHIGRVIYTGVYEPGSPLADEHGYRRDVEAAAAELAPTVLRWPGGNFASGYHWRDGVGPVGDRPLRHDLAWDAFDPNTFGTEEFLELARRIGAEPYINLNASTGTIDEAVAWLEYCNATQPLPEVKLRQTGPHPEPHGVRIWGIGNENYGWWQHGHTSADRYAEVAREWGKLLKWAGGEVDLVGVGAPDPAWNEEVLKTAGIFLDYISLHFYWPGGDDPYHTVIAGPVRSEAHIERTAAMCREAQRAQGRPAPVRIAVDEWNVWAKTVIAAGSGKATPYETMVRGLSARSGIDTRFEEVYDLKDALAVASWFHVMWRHPEEIGMATQAQMVNAIAPILTGPDGLVRQTIFYPFALATKYAGPASLRVEVGCETGVLAPGLEAGSLPAIDAGATFDPDSGRLHLSIVNRHRDEEAVVDLDGAAGDGLRIELGHEDPLAANTLDRPELVTPRPARTEGGKGIVLPPHSHTTFVFEGRAPHI